MASYGFEFEFPNYYFVSAAPLKDGTCLFDIVRKDKNIVLYQIKAVNCTKASDTRTGWISTLKAVSVPNALTQAELLLFDPLTAFLNLIHSKLSSKDPFVQLSPGMPAWDLISVNTYNATYVFNGKITLKAHETQSIDSLHVLPQFSFGFNAPRTLMDFYKHFDPVNVLDMNRVKQPEKGCFDRSPFSTDAEMLFLVMFRSLQVDQSWADFWCALEFLRLSLGFSMAREISQSDTNQLGNRAYMRIMARTSFRSMFQNVIPAVIFDETKRYTINTAYGIVEDLTAFDMICAYIRYGFKSDFQMRIPFWHLNTSSKLANKEYMKTDTTVGNPDLQRYYRDKTSTNAIVASVLLPKWQTLDFASQLNEAVSRLFTKDEQNEIAPQISQMVDNMQTCDMMSPLPFSLPADAMGYYTRASVSGTPKFLFEMRYMEKFYQVSTEQTACVYNSIFQNWCLSEFNTALKDWKAEPPSKN